MISQKEWGFMKKSKEKTVSQILNEIRLHETMQGEITVSSIMKLLGDRTFGLALLFFALPSALPISAIPGIAFLFSIPIAFFSLELIFGRQTFWVPSFIGNKIIPNATVNKIVDSSIPYLQKIERFLKPRLDFMLTKTIDRLTGFLILIMSILLMLPIPFSNMIIAGILIIFSLGFITKDGLFIILGYIFSILYISSMYWLIFHTFKRLFH